MILDDLGDFTKDEDLGWYYSKEMTITLIDSLRIRFVLDLFDDYSDYKTKYIEAIHNIMKIKTEKIKEAEDAIYNYYKDCIDLNKKIGFLNRIKNGRHVWHHIKWGNEPLVTYREIDNTAYISFECECDWEIEHGLQIVFKNGQCINKVGSYDGHLTNSDAFAKPEFENEIYISRKKLSF